MGKFFFSFGHFYESFGHFQSAFIDNKGLQNCVYSQGKEFSSSGINFFLQDLISTEKGGKLLIEIVFMKMYPFTLMLPVKTDQLAPGAEVIKLFSCSTQLSMKF